MWQGKQGDGPSVADLMEDKIKYANCYGLKGLKEIHTIQLKNREWMMEEEQEHSDPYHWALSNAALNAICNVRPFTFDSHSTKDMTDDAQLSLLKKLASNESLMSLPFGSIYLQNIPNARGDIVPLTVLEAFGSGVRPFSRMVGVLLWTGILNMGEDTYKAPVDIRDPKEILYMENMMNNSDLHIMPVFGDSGHLCLGNYHFNTKRILEEFEEQQKWANKDSYKINNTRTILAVLSSLQLISDCAEVRPNKNIPMKKGNQDQPHSATRINSSIGSIVHVRGRFTAPVTSVTVGPTRAYSHRFDIRGHWRTVRGIGKDCSGSPISGKTWIRGSIKGPKNKPYVKKIRVVDSNKRD